MVDPTNFGFHIDLGFTNIAWQRCEYLVWVRGSKFSGDPRYICKTVRPEMTRSTPRLTGRSLQLPSDMSFNSLVWTINIWVFP